MNPSGEELGEPTQAGKHDGVDEQAEAPVSAPTAEQWRAIEEPRSRSGNPPPSSP